VSRVPALVISPLAKKGYVGHTVYDMNSILRFISRVHGLAPPGDLTASLDLV